MSWQNEISELIQRLKLAKNLIGKDKIKIKHDAKRFTVRERIELFFDKKSFQEIGI